MEDVENGVERLLFYPTRITSSFITVRNSSCRKVMFPQACVKNSVYRRVCMVRGCAWPRGMHGQGACMAGGTCMGNVHGKSMLGACMAGGMHGGGYVWQGACMAGGHAWQRGHVWQAACMAWGMHGRGACVAGGHAWWGVCMAGETATAAVTSAKKRTQLPLLHPMWNAGSLYKPMIYITRCRSHSS